MKVVRIIIVLFALLLVLGGSRITAQTLNVEAFGEDFFSAEAQGCHVQDQNGNCCSLLKVLVIDDRLEFTSDGLVKSETRGKNEFWAWLSPGSKEVTVKSGNYPMIKVKFADYNTEIKSLQAKHAYILKLRVIIPEAKKTKVTLTCNVPDAKLYIDGYDADKASGTYQLAPGEHVLMADKATYETYMGSIIVLPDKKSQKFDIFMDTVITDPGGQYDYARTIKYKHPERQLKWIMRAAEGGWPEAMYMLANLYMGWRPKYENVIQLDTDTIEAIKWFTRAAQADVKYAYVLGDLYYNGIGVKVDKQEAFKWYLRATQHRQVFHTTLRKVAEMYEFGEGTEKDLVKAKEFYKKALVGSGRDTRKQVMSALERLSQKFEEGKDVKQAISCWDIIKEFSQEVLDGGIMRPTENYYRAEAAIKRLKEKRG